MARSTSRSAMVPLGYVLPTPWKLITGRSAGSLARAGRCASATLMRVPHKAPSKRGECRAGSRGAPRGRGEHGRIHSDRARGGDLPRPCEGDAQARDADRRRGGSQRGIPAPGRPYSTPAQPGGTVGDPTRFACDVERIETGEGTRPSIRPGRKMLLSSRHFRDIRYRVVATVRRVRAV